MTREPVVVTGMGVVTPAGHTLAAFWSALLSGRSTATALTAFDVAQHQVRFACQVTGLDDAGVLSPKESRRMDPFARFGVTAALLAYRDAGEPGAEPGRAAIVAGNAVGGRRTSDEDSRRFTEGGPARVNPLMPLLTMPNAAAALTSIRLGWTGPAHTVATTCASGVDAVGHGTAMLQSGRADVVLAGGCESIVSPVTMAAFGNLTAVSGRNDDPAAASRPFDADRDGFVMGEGAGFVVLERLSDALARGARIHGEIAGYASGSDAYHLSMPRPDGTGAATTMAAAIADAGLSTDDIVHVNAHGTSTVHNDRAEARALGRVFGAAVPPVTASKGVLGHLIGAAGAVELIATVLAVRDAVVPPTANFEKLDPEMDIDVVHAAPRPVRPGAALTNSFGFGGHNACLVVKPA